MEQNSFKSSKKDTALLDNIGNLKIYYFAVFGGVALNTIIYVVMGWGAVVIAMVYQSNNSMGYYPEWLQLAGDSVFIMSILIGGFVAASIADSSEIFNATCVGLFDILLTVLQLALFENLYSDLMFLLLKSLSVIILAALGGYFAVLRKKRVNQSFSEYFDQK